MVAADSESADAALPHCRSAARSMQTAPILTFQIKTQIKHIKPCLYTKNFVPLHRQNESRRDSPLMIKIVRIKSRNCAI